MLIGNNSKMSTYSNNGKNNMYIETADSKKVRQNVNIAPANGIIYNCLETENSWHTFIGAVCSRIKSVKYNNKNCYEITGFLSSSSLSYDKQKIYVEKDTGLLVKIEAEGVYIEREQEFNNVDDSIFEEPDISQYEIQENN